MIVSIIRFAVRVLILSMLLNAALWIGMKIINCGLKIGRLLTSK